MKHLNNQKGSAMILTIILLMVVSILGVAMLFPIVSEVKINKSMEEKMIATYLAQAGIDHGLHLIENQSATLTYPHEVNVELGDSSRTYYIMISKIGSELKIKSTGMIIDAGAVKRQVSLEATVLENGQVIIEE